MGGPSAAAPVRRAGGLITVLQRLLTVGGVLAALLVAPLGGDALLTRLGTSVTGTWWVVATVTVAGVVSVEARRREQAAARVVAENKALVARAAAAAEGEVDVDRLKDDFITAVSHELRTPLQVLKGLAELLERGGDRLPTDQRDQLVRRLVANAERLDTLLLDLLDVERLHRGAEAAPRTMAPVAAALDAVLPTLDTSATELTVEVGEAAGRLAPGHLERIVYHLVANAIRYGASPDGTVRATVRATEDDEALHLVVTDAGRGIPTGERLRVFEPLHRVHDDSPSPGLGVGLALVRRLTLLYGGRAWIDDGPAGGTAAHVRIPHDAPPIAMDAWSVQTATGRSW